MKADVNTTTLSTARLNLITFTPEVKSSIHKSECRKPQTIFWSLIE